MATVTQFVFGHSAATGPEVLLKEMERPRALQAEDDVGESKTGAAKIEDVYRDNYGSLKHFLGRFLTSPAEVEDVLQEGFLKAFIAQRQSQIAEPKAFLYATCKNLALNILSRDTRQKTSLVAGFDDPDVLGGMELTDELDPEMRTAVNQELRYAIEGIRSMTPRVREVFVMRKVYGFSHKEIADRLGIAISTVEKHIAQGVLDLKRYTDQIR